MYRIADNLYIGIDNTGNIILTTYPIKPMKGKIMSIKPVFVQPLTIVHKDKQYSQIEQELITALKNGHVRLMVNHHIVRIEWDLDKVRIDGHDVFSLSALSYNDIASRIIQYCQL